MKAIILAAGKGMRLESHIPKCMTQLSSGEMLLSYQLRALSTYIDINDVIAVVGYKKELVMESFPELMFVYNHMYAITGPLQSLELGLRKVKDEDLLWLNGDVIFQKEILGQLFHSTESRMVVNKSKMLGREEVKYALSSQGTVRRVSKELRKCAGEVLGINFFKAKDVDLIKRAARSCDKKDFAIKAIDIAIKDGLKVFPAYVGKEFCDEIDFHSDLVRVNSFLRKHK